MDFILELSKKKEHIQVLVMSAHVQNEDNYQTSDKNYVSAAVMIKLSVMERRICYFLSPPRTIDMTNTRTKCFHSIALLLKLLNK